MKVDLAVAAVVVVVAAATAEAVVAAATAEAVVVAAVATAEAVVAAATVEVAAAIARMVLATITANLPISSFQKRPGEIRAVFFCSQGRGCWEPAAFRIPDALCRVSSHSFSGSDPAVIPAPTWKAASPSRMTTVLMAMLNWVRPS